jgi:outer membrane protein assembly factor BamB
VAVGDDPEHGEGDGHLWCIDPTRRGDVSSHLAMKQVDGQLIPIPHRRIQAVIREEGEVAVDNPNSAMVWHYGKSDQNGDGKFDFEETMHRTTSNAAIKNGLLIIPDLSGLVHCLDARTGKCHWTVDLQASCWGSPVIVGDKVYLGDEDGDISILPLSSDLQTLPKRSNKAGLKNKEVDLIAAEPLLIIPTGSCVYSTPIVVNEVLYFANNQGVFAITTEK